MPRSVKVTGFVIALLTYLLLCWTAAYFITGFVFHEIHVMVAPYLSQLMNASLGSVFMMLTVSVLVRVTRFGQRADYVRVQITNTLRQIAKGNFKVNLELPRQGPFIELAESINQMAGELNEMEQMRQEFISNVSHEIQSPLTSINGFARVLKKEGLAPEEREHYLDIIEVESLRLSQLSDNLLKLTSLESDHHPFAPERYRLDKQLQNVVLVAEPHWQAKDLNVELTLSEIWVHADKDLLNQVWTNLLHNAIKFTPNAGTVSIGTMARSDEVVVQVQDTGIGILPGDQEHIFERFFKGDKSRNRTAGGSGLGLSIVKKIIDMHDGVISVESHSNGTRFTVRIPNQRTNAINASSEHDLR